MCKQRSDVILAAVPLSVGQSQRKIHHSNTLLTIEFGNILSLLFLLSDCLLTALAQRASKLTQLCGERHRLSLLSVPQCVTGSMNRILTIVRVSVCVSSWMANGSALAALPNRCVNAQKKRREPTDNTQFQSRNDIHHTHSSQAHTAHTARQTEFYSDI